MANATTTSNKEKSQIFETILSSPGMNEKCKISLSLSRLNILFLSRLIDGVLLSEKTAFDDTIIGAIPKETADEMKIINKELLEKGGLTEFYEKLKLI